MSGILNLVNTDTCNPLIVIYGLRTNTIDFWQIALHEHLATVLTITI
jgi:hypothetical protein